MKIRLETGNHDVDSFVSGSPEWNFLSIYPPSNLVLNDPIGGCLDPPGIGILQGILGDDRLQWGIHGAGGAIDSINV